MVKGGKREGAGRPQLEEVRKNHSIKFTDTEWETVNKKAKAEDQTASDYVRKKALEE